MNSWGASILDVAAPTGPNRSRTGDRPPIRVLVADDDESVRRTLVRIVSSSPSLHLVGQARDVEEAIRLAVESRPDVAVVDVCMPGGGGARVAEALAIQVPSTKVLALSGSTDRGGVMEMLAAGATGYIVKGGGLNLVSAVEATSRGEGILTSEIAGDVIGELSQRLSRQRDEDRHHLARMGSIREALAGGFHMVFQPVVRLDTGAVAGYEALARFYGLPQRTPDRWFAEAAELGLGFELETAAVSAAVSTMLAATSAGVSPGFLCVNFSPRTLMDSRFADWFGAVPYAGGLVIEITEHAEVDDYGRLSSALDAARNLGASVSVDDAGSGYSSLPHIALLKPDVIKLDGSLVTGLSLDPAKRAVAIGMISSARELGAEVVAEAIEDQQDLDCVKQLGADMGQGYFLGRPGPLPGAPLESA